MAESGVREAMQALEEIQRECSEAIHEPRWSAEFLEFSIRKILKLANRGRESLLQYSLTMHDLDGLNKLAANTAQPSCAGEDDK